MREERSLRVFENRVLRRRLGPDRDYVTVEWRKLHSGELRDIYCSPDTIRVIRSGGLRWAEYVVRMGRGEGHTGFWWGNLRESEHLEDPYVDGTIVLKWIFKKQDGRGVYWTDLAQVRDKYRLFLRR